MAVFEIGHCHLLRYDFILLYVLMPKMSYSSAAFAVLSYILYPVFLLLKAVLTILLILAAPIVHLGRYLFYACSWPIHFLARFEVNRKILSIHSELITSVKTLYVGRFRALVSFSRPSLRLQGLSCERSAQKTRLATQHLAENSHIDSRFTNRSSSVSQR